MSHYKLLEEHWLTPCSQPAGEDDDDPLFAAASTALTETEAKDDMQTFVFSATLSKDLQQNLKKRGRKPLKRAGRKATALGACIVEAARSSRSDQCRGPRGEARLQR